MVHKAARKLLCDMSDLRPAPRALSAAQIDLVESVTADNDHSITADAIEQLADALNSSASGGGGDPFAEMSMLLTRRLAEPTPATKLKALRLIMVMPAKCGPRLTSALEQDAVRLLDATATSTDPAALNIGKPEALVRGHIIGHARNNM